MWLTLFLIFILCLVLVGVWFGVSALIGVVRTRVPLVHSSPDHAAEVFTALGFSESTVFFELGSGNGQIVFLAERMGAGHAVGFELVSWAHTLAIVRRWWKGSHAEFKRADFMSARWGDATVLYTYLLPELLPQVYQKFMTECPRGAVLVCKDFAVPGVEADRMWRFDRPHCAYAYTKR